jgi:HD-GYP domain-containing protein (c-di-GMP phosphodiesterase class II)
MPDRPGSLASSPEARELVARAREVIRLLAVLIRNATLHHPDNEVFREPKERLRTTVQELLDREGRFDLECVGPVLWANRTPLRVELRTQPTYRLVADELARRRLGGLRFLDAPRPETVSGLLRALARREAPTQDPVHDFNLSLAETGVHDLVALPPVKEVLGRAAASRRGRALGAYRQTLDLIRELMTGEQSEEVLNLRRAKRAVHRLVDVSYEEGEGFSLAGLAAIKSHNEYTFNHMVNVCVLAVAFGQRLGLDRQQLAHLGICALYHDIGKVAIPLEILDKHGTLSEREWAVMGNHTVFGARTLLPMVAHDARVVRRILTSLQHHRGYAEGGYPELRVLRRQGLFVRIVAIADAFDAMTTKRVYQKAFLPDQALATIKAQAGTRYDPILVKAFINCLGVFPVGSLVLLSSGELAVVVEASPDPATLDRPTVKVIADSAWQPHPPVSVDLSHQLERGRRIVRCLDPEPLGIDLGRYVV